MNRPIDAELLAQLLDEQGPTLALYAAQWTDSPDDCVQEALVELAGLPVEPENVRAWLYRVVKHRALNAARGARRRRQREARAIADRLAAPTRPRAMDQCDALAIVESLERLQSTDREVVVMRIWGGLTYEEIAAALSLSVSSVHRHYHQALELLRQILESPCSTNANRDSLN